MNLSRQNLRNEIVTFEIAHGEVDAAISSKGPGAVLD